MDICDGTCSALLLVQRISDTGEGGSWSNRVVERGGSWKADTNTITNINTYFHMNTKTNTYTNTQALGPWGQP